MKIPFKAYRTETDKKIAAEWKTCGGNPEKIEIVWDKYKGHIFCMIITPETVIDGETFEIDEFRGFMVGLGFAKMQDPYHKAGSDILPYYKEY